MEIKRMVNGKEYTFELTDQEMSDAFYEQQNNFDRNDIESNFDCGYDFEDILDSEEEIEYALTIYNDPDVIEEAAKLYRKWLDNDDRWYTLSQEAFEQVVREHVEDHF